MFKLPHTHEFTHEDLKSISGKDIGLISANSREVVPGSSENCQHIRSREDIHYRADSNCASVGVARNGNVQ